MAVLCVGLALLAASPWPAIPSTVWPVLATIFMFRMMIYLYEVKHARAPESLVDTVELFLLAAELQLHALSGGRLPDAPARFLRRRRARHPAAGPGDDVPGDASPPLLPADLSRALDPAAEVHGPWTLAGYLACNYLLYLRVSGQFHIACGMLHLFGYQLPETHHRYLLATGFTDYWRRINIYWKDFMVRLFFNPVVFRLKRWPQPAALAVATLTVFLATWMLHAYQSFWLRGTLGVLGSRRDVLGRAGGAGPRERSARRAGSLSRNRPERPQDAGTAAGGRISEKLGGGSGPRPEDGGHLHHDRPALVALVEPQPDGLAGSLAPRPAGM